MSCTNSFMSIGRSTYPFVLQEQRKGDKSSLFIQDWNFYSLHSKFIALIAMSAILGAFHWNGTSD